MARRGMHNRLLVYVWVIYFLERLFRVLRRAVLLDYYANKHARGALGEIVEPLKAMIEEMIEYALDHKASQKTLHRVFYERYREQYPWMPTRVVKGSYRDAVRKAKAFREARKRGRAYTDRPEVRRVETVYPDNQVEGLRMSIMLRTHGGWVELRYRDNKQLHRYLYSGWRLSRELKLEPGGRRVLAYIAFSRSFEILYDPSNVVSLDINENSVMIAAFRDGVLAGVTRIETGLGRMVIAYSVRRERISRRRSTVERGVKKKLMRLREGDRKQGILYKVASLIEEIHQWSASKLIEPLGDRPIHAVRVSEKGSSSVDPFSMKRIDSYSPLVIRTAVRGNNGRYKVVKIVLRIAYVDERVVKRDAVGAINIGLKYLSSDGRPVASGSTGTHAVRVKPMIPSLGATPLAEIQVFGSIIKYR
jgi:transposase